jgi:hypothetical protein
MGRNYELWIMNYEWRLILQATTLSGDFQFLKIYS